MHRAASLLSATVDASAPIVTGASSVTRHLRPILVAPASPRAVQGPALDLSMSVSVSVGVDVSVSVSVDLIARVRPPHIGRARGGGGRCQAKVALRGGGVGAVSGKVSQGSYTVDGAATSALPPDHASA